MLRTCVFVKYGENLECRIWTLGFGAKRGFDTGWSGFGGRSLISCSNWAHIRHQKCKKKKIEKKRKSSYSDVGRPLASLNHRHYLHAKAKAYQNTSYCATKQKWTNETVKIQKKGDLHIRFWVWWISRGFYRCRWWWQGSCCSYK